MEKELINYGGALYSLAEIDIKAYIELLKNIDETLTEPIEAMNLIFKYKNPNKDICECLKKISLTKFCEAKKSLTIIKKKVDKYEKQLAEYLKNNLEKMESFSNLKEAFDELIESEIKFINEYIAKCFEFLKEHNCQNGID